MNGKGMRPIVGYNYGKYRENYPKSMGKKPAAKKRRGRK